MKGKHRFITAWPVIVALVLLTLISVLAPVHAQDAAPTALTLGQTLPGEISANTPTPRFVLNISAPQAVSVQVLAITSGVPFGFTVRDPDGVVIQSVANPAAQPIVQANASLSAVGDYIIEVQSANNAPGQFAISAQPGIPAPPASLLTIGQAVSASVDAQQSVQTYSFDSSQQDVLLLTVKSDMPVTGSVVTLHDGITGDILAISNLRLLGARYRIPIGINNYMLAVTHSGSASPEPYTVCLETESGSITCGGGSAAPTAAVPVECLAMAAGGVSVNVRTGPGVEFGIITSLPAGAQAPVIGKLADASWFQINFGGTIGWVSAPFVTVTGDCGASPIVTPPPPPPPAPTAVPTFTPTTAPTTEPTATNTPEPPTNTPTITPTDSGGVICCVTLRPGILVTFVVNPEINPEIINPGGPVEGGQNQQGGG